MQDGGEEKNLPECGRLLYILLNLPPELSLLVLRDRKSAELRTSALRSGGVQEEVQEEMLPRLGQEDHALS